MRFVAKVQESKQKSKTYSWIRKWIILPKRIADKFKKGEKVRVSVKKVKKK